MTPLWCCHTFAIGSAANGGRWRREKGDTANVHDSEGLTALQARIKEAEAELARLREDHARREQELERRETVLAQLEDEQIHLRAEVAALEEDHTAIRGWLSGRAS